ncbi:MAG TPA: dienelactone hydrolase family protein [Verrucomicrobiae bacterium]|nr:dienelactone hydrolase family protein [Verrucomicrobiae bacterium]
MRNTHILIALTIGLTACGKRSDDAADTNYSERMAQQHAQDQPTPSLAARASARAAVKSQPVDYATINGRTITGYLAYPTAAEGGLPGILVFHEWWGLNANIKSMADQLAAHGYVVLATDLYNGNVAEQPDAARALMDKALHDRESMAQNLRQAHGYLREQVKATRVGTIGWCFGGSVSLRAGLLLADQVDAVVLYYGHVGSDPAELKSLGAPVLGLFGAADDGIPVESVRAFESTLKQLGKPAEIHLYPGAAHAFANPSGGNYKPDAAADAWAKTLAFLAQHLKGD